LTIAYAVILNRKLAALRGDKETLKKLAGEFASATSRAEDGILMLKSAGEEASKIVADNLAKAQSLRDDLAYLVERGEAAADRLESSVRNVRTMNPANAGESRDESGGQKPSRGASPADELIKALQAAR
jgi:hypothetical protein